MHGYSTIQLILLIMVRILVGWHFLYEGVYKLITPSWSSYGYLLDAKGFLAPLLIKIAVNPNLINIVNFLNTWGLIAIGLGLILGIFAHLTKITGILMLLLYYFSQPPLIGYEYVQPGEGNYIIVNKILIEVFVIALLLVFPTERSIGLDRLIFFKKSSV